MKVITYCLCLLGVMAAVNTVIRFTENAHKYGPILKTKLNPAVPFIVEYSFHPVTVSLLALAILITAATLAPAGDASLMIDPFGLPIPPFGVL